MSCAKFMQEIKSLSGRALITVTIEKNSFGCGSCIFLGLRFDFHNGGCVELGKLKDEKWRLDEK